MTMRYSHLAPQHKPEAVERLVRFGSMPTGTRTGIIGFEGADTAAAGSVQVQQVQ
ncbi:MAG TPA: hypothetical protein VNE83_08695 [Terriglobales bacterium]|nr:hypothetical protein [Terriglobales bacterium]